MKHDNGNLYGKLWKWFKFKLYNMEELICIKLIWMRCILDYMLYINMNDIYIKIVG